MKYAVIDARMSHKCRKSLVNLGLNLIEITENPYLDKPVSAHPDLSVFSYNNTIIAEQKCYTILKKHLFEEEKCGFDISEGCKYEANTDYPYDCTLNFAVCGNFLIGNMKYVNKKLLDIAKNNNLTLIDVKQGYAKCNICKISQNALITEDKGIAVKCREYEIDVLLLENNFVKLNGYNYGFIGGASGTIYSENENKVLFCGCIEDHPEYVSIKHFCKKYGAEPISLSDEHLYDYGSIIIL